MTNLRNACHFPYMLSGECASCRAPGTCIIPKLDTEGDHWIALDKAQHFAVCAFLVVAGYLGASTSKYHRHRLWIAIAPAAVVAAVKELGDLLGVGSIACHLLTCAKLTTL